MPDVTFEQALRDNIEKIDSSAVFLSLHHPDMADFEADPWPAIQLAIAILQDKPIVLIKLPGRELPERLVRLADRIIEGPIDEAMGDRLRAVLEELAP